jgi:hypothetical protein
MLVTFFIAIFVEIALLCSRNLARRVPINYILLFIFTASFSYAISYTCKIFRLLIIKKFLNLFFSKELIFFFFFFLNFKMFYLKFNFSQLFHLLI